MASYHVVPRGDAIQHDTRSNHCACVVEPRTCAGEEPGEVDVWYYHRRVSIEEALAVPHAKAA